MTSGTCMPLWTTLQATINCHSDAKLPILDITKRWGEYKQDATISHAQFTKSHKVIFSFFFPIIYFLHFSPVFHLCRKSVLPVSSIFCLFFFPSHISCKRRACSLLPNIFPMHLLTVFRLCFSLLLSLAFVVHLYPLLSCYTKNWMGKEHSLTECDQILKGHLHIQYPLVSLGNLKTLPLIPVYSLLVGSLQVKSEDDLKF